MSHLQNRILKASQLFCHGALVLLSCLPAHAQFVPDKGITASHWKEPVGGLEGYRWLSDKEVMYAHHSTPGYHFVKWDIAAKTEHELSGFSQLTRQSRDDSLDPPRVFPSPNGRYVAWIVGSRTLWVSSVDGSVIASHRGQMGIAYPYWSEDSQSCFCFLTGNIPLQGPFYIAIAAINMNMPFAVKTHTILDGGLMGDISVDHLRLANVHFKKTGQISVIAKRPFAEIKMGIEEYTLTESAKLVSTYALVKPDSDFLIINAVFSPTGDFIAWRFRNGDTAEIWISDGHGNNMLRLGKLLQKETSLPYSGDPSELQWLPSGKGISFREAGELWVVDR
ncbi:MAG: hypothetical protein JWN14_1197 [Chthonomonadales bacterium]|nr:hypothetical protein [Chthonomonadales bacterium]